MSNKKYENPRLCVFIFPVEQCKPSEVNKGGIEIECDTTSPVVPKNSENDDPIYIQKPYLDHIDENENGIESITLSKISVNTFRTFF